MTHLAVKLLAIVLLLLPLHVAAQEQENPLDIRALMNDKCSAGGEADQASCIDKILGNLVQEMNKEIEEAIKRAEKSEWGEKEAALEEQQRIHSSQDAWLKYRNEHCATGYYSRATIHSSSQDKRIKWCEAIKTAERLQEIKETYDDR